jgi:proteasome assembly chaperone (PAC2) family protein
MSELTWAGEPKLDRPILVVALAGLFDAASVATGATKWLVHELHAEPLAHIDAESFFDFHEARPRVELTPDGRRRVVWPELVAHATARGAGERDLVLLSGMEPHLRWRTFTDIVVELATGAGVEMIVTLGASPAQTPHTRPPVVFGSSTNAELAARLGLSRPQYQGPTGVLGVLQAALDVGGPPAIAMRVGVPHYAMGDHDPKATMALLRHLEHVTGVSTAHGKLGPDVARWEDRLSAAVADDAEARAYVSQLEARYDTETEQQVSSGEDLAEELERFLREQRGDS